VRWRYWNGRSQEPETTEVTKAENRWILRMHERELALSFKLVPSNSPECEAIAVNY
jgi:hypothetical protein